MAERPKVALVTGASGFIGSHLVESLLSRGWRVRCLVRKSASLKWIPTDDVTLMEGDVAVAGETLERAVKGVSVVFHLAGLTSATSDTGYSVVNVEGTRHIIDAIRAEAPKALLAFCSSLAAGGPSDGKRPVNETDPPAPVSAYGRSKLAAEKVVTESGLDSFIVRPPAVYGPRDSDIHAVFKMAAYGFSLRVAPIGQRLSLIHVQDLARGFVQAAEREGRGLYYMTDGKSHTWDEVMQHVSRATGKKPYVLTVAPGIADMISRAERFRATMFGSKPLLTPDRITELMQQDWTCDDTFARLDVDYESTISLAEGLKSTAEWYRAQGWLPR